MKSLHVSSISLKLMGLQNVMLTLGGVFSLHRIQMFSFFFFKDVGTAAEWIWPNRQKRIPKYIRPTDQIKTESLHSETDALRKIYLAFMPAMPTLLGNKLSNNNNMKCPQNLDCYLLLFFVIHFLLYIFLTRQKNQRNNKFYNRTGEWKKIPLCLLHYGPVL